MSYRDDGLAPTISAFDKVMGGLIGIMVILCILMMVNEPADKGRCVKTRHVEDVSYYTVKPPMWHKIPAHDVCDEWEFPEGRPN